MFKTTSNVLGRPQADVISSIANQQQFLGSTSGSPPMYYPGMAVEAYDPVFGVAEFVLAYGVAGLLLHDWVRIANGYATTRSAAAIRGRMGVSMSANTDPTALSWFCVRGICPANVAAAVAINTPLFVTATTGAADDAVVAGDNIVGATAATAQSATVTTKSIGTVNASTRISVPDTAGLYVGQSVTGVGVGAAAVITSIGTGGQMYGTNGPPVGFIEVSVASTATGRVTGTFALSATKILAMLAYPTCTGAV